MCYGSHAEVRGQLEGIGFLLTPRGSQDSNSGQLGSRRLHVLSHRGGPKLVLVGDRWQHSLGADRLAWNDPGLGTLTIVGWGLSCLEYIQ